VSDRQNTDESNKSNKARHGEQVSRFDTLPARLAACGPIVVRDANVSCSSCTAIGRLSFPSSALRRDNFVKLSAQEPIRLPAKQQHNQVCIVPR
jgi:hypothetical protein